MLVPGTHSVTVTDAAGCQTTCSVRISNAFQEFSCWGMVDRNVSCEGGSDGIVYVVPTGGVEPYTYKWSNGANTHIIENLEAGSYGVTVTDANGCVSYCVVGVAEPKIELTCPEPLEVSCNDPERNAKIEAWLNRVSTSKSCEENPVIEHDYKFENFSGNCVAEQMVTFSHEAPNGRIAACQATIRLVHEGEPEMICPPSVDLTCEDGLPVKDFTGGKIISSCGLEYGLDVTWVADEDQPNPPEGSRLIFRTYEATDNCGNTVNCIQEIVIEADDVAPAIEPSQALATIGNGGTIRVEAAFDDPDWTPIQFSAADITATDLNTPVTVGLNRILVNDYSDCENGVIQRWQALWTAVDACGQSSEFSIFVEVVDNTPPELASTPEEFVEAACDDLPDPILEVADNGLHYEVLFTEEYLTPFCGTVYELSRTWTPIDACGNEGESFTQVITVKRQLDAPVISFASPHMQGLENGDNYSSSCDEFNWLLRNEGVMKVTTSCGSAFGLTLEQEELEGEACQDNGGNSKHRLTWRAIDECDRESVFELIVDVIDQNPPSLFFEQPEFAGFQHNSTVVVSCREASILIDKAPAINVYDDCDPEPRIRVASSVLNENADPCSPGNQEPAYQVTWTATDRCGNAAEFSLKLIVADNEPPVFVDPPEDLCTDELPPVPAELTAMDECSDEVHVVFNGESREECFTGGIRVVRTWTAFDQCGNSTKYSQHITFNDNFPPSLFVLSPNGEMVEEGAKLTLPTDCSSALPYGLPEFEVSVSDHCHEALGFETSVELLETGDCDQDGFLYRVFVTHSATDACGNEGSRSYEVTLTDEVAPVFDVQSLSSTIYCTEEFPVPLMSDCDPNAELSLLHESPTDDLCNSDAVQIIRTWMAVDRCGNTTVADQVILIRGKHTPEDAENAGKGPELPNTGRPLSPALSKTGDIKVFPNPTRELAYLDLSDFAGQSGQLRIVNLMGQVVHLIHMDQVAEGVQVLNVERFRSGLYTIVFRTGEGVVKQEKLLISK